MPMHDLIGHTLSVFLGFFAIMNPLANTPVFLALTAGEDRNVTRQVARNAVLLTFCIIAVVCVVGRLIFALFGITLPAFQIMGGVLVALIGFRMLQGESSSVHKPSDTDIEDSMEARLSIAVSPLAVPILAGPGTITTAMNFAAAPGTYELIITVLGFAVLCLVTYLCFVSGRRIVRVLGRNGLNVVTRIMGLILSVVGVQMLIDGIRGAFPAVGS